MNLTASIPTYSSSLYEVDHDLRLTADSTRLAEGAMLVFEMLTKSYFDHKIIHWPHPKGLNSVNPDMFMPPILNFDKFISSTLSSFVSFEKQFQLHCYKTTLCFLSIRPDYLLFARLGARKRMKSFVISLKNKFRSTKKNFIESNLCFLLRNRIFFRFCKMHSLSIVNTNKMIGCQQIMKSCFHK